ncbi:MAG: DUF2271 domain-containing protein [Planctomycetaceae bacterium]|nr:DUF2271 domain-containing protein [Planctomycetaceae bacterium]
MSKVRFMLAALTLTVAWTASAWSANAPAAATPVEKGVEVSFDFSRKGGTGTNQYAIWIEDADGKFIKTIFVTSFTTVRGGWRYRNENLPRWIEASNVAKMPRKKMDAISGATAGNRRVVKYWDLTDEDGDPVPNGDYTVFLEGTIRRENQVLYRAQIYVGGEPATIEPLPEYTGKATTDRDMIQNVVVKYTP